MLAAGSGINRAAIDYGVPSSTLKDRRVIHGAKPGPLSYLSNKEEGELANLCFCGVWKTRRDV